MTLADILFEQLKEKGTKVRLLKVIDHDETHRYSISHIHPYIEMTMYELFFVSGKWFYRDSFKGPLKPISGELVNFIHTQRLKDDKK